MKLQQKNVCVIARFIGMNWELDSMTFKIFLKKCFFAYFWSFTTSHESMFPIIDPGFAIFSDMTQVIKKLFFQKFIKSSHYSSIHPKQLQNALNTAVTITQTSYHPRSRILFS